jgi:hypothetical protein
MLVLIISLRVNVCLCVCMNASIVGRFSSVSDMTLAAWYHRIVALALEQHICTLDQLFDKWDNNRDGFVDIDEWMDGVQELKLGLEAPPPPSDPSSPMLSAADARAVFARLDPNSSGMMSKATFVEACTRPCFVVEQDQVLAAALAGWEAGWSYCRMAYGSLFAEKFPRGILSLSQFAFLLRSVDPPVRGLMGPDGQPAPSSERLIRSMYQQATVVERRRPAINGMRIETKHPLPIMLDTYATCVYVSLCAHL